MTASSDTIFADTIFALSSGRVPSAIAVVRISGTHAGPLLRNFCGRLPVPRHATLATLRDPQQQPIDDAVVLWFPGPHSATGEDMAELQVHGSNAVLARLFALMIAESGVRPAEAGEFTRRSFANGKLDLTEAEGLDDLIHADTDAQRRQALRQLKGMLGQRAENWRQRIVEASALIEAGIDFADEGDVPSDLMAPAFAAIKALRTEIAETIAVSGRSERLREGLVVAIAGPPNVGKSSLLNRLARRDAAIVSPHAGTTRDVIEVQLDIDGYPVALLDTAGIHDAQDPVEQEGVRRARDRAATADLVLWLSDASAPSNSVGEPDAIGAAPIWRVVSKIDLPRQYPAGRAAKPQIDFELSAATGAGLDILTAALGKFAASYFGAGDAAVITRARHRQLLEATVEGLDSALAAQAQGEEIVAEELRVAAHALGKLLGRIDVEDILDVIFRDFCIGK